MQSDVDIGFAVNAKIKKLMFQNLQTHLISRTNTLSSTSMKYQLILYCIITHVSNEAIDFESCEF